LEEQLEFDFIPYEPSQYKRHQGAPTVTIAKDGRIAINIVASEYLKDFRYADLFYNEKLNVVGIKPTNEKTSRSMSLGKQARSNARMIVAQGFTKQFGLQKEKTYRYPVEWNEKLGMLIVRLDNGQIVTSGKRKGKDSQPFNLQLFAEMTAAAID